MTAPLDDLFVVDASTLFAGPMAAMHLGDMGARVVKVEHPRRPDPSRGHGPAKDGENLWWKTLGRNKQTVTLDLHTSGGVEAFLRLAAVARDYASAVSGRDMSAQTLSDLHRGDRDARHRDGLNLLRQTIEALYPAEFADPQLNSAARQTDVRQAAEWVSTLVERWR